MPEIPHSEDPTPENSAAPENSVDASEAELLEGVDAEQAQLAQQGRKLEVIGYVAVILISLATLGVKWSMRPPEPLAKGDQLDVLQEHLVSDKDQTIVLAISPNCPHCTKSMPFFRQIIEKRNAEGISKSVIVALHEQTPVEEEQKILDKNNVKVDKIVQLDMDKMNVQGVPTMLLVDRDGKVLEVWNGRLPEEEQKKVLAAL